jgi:hypothetical protein
MEAICSSKRSDDFHRATKQLSILEDRTVWLTLAAGCPPISFYISYFDRCENLNLKI